MDGKIYNERIDIMKGVAILLVVTGHFIQFSVIDGGIHNPVYLWIYKFHMEVFFFCSGFLLKGLDMEKGFLSFMSLFEKKLFRLVLPFIIWSTVILYMNETSFSRDVFFDYLWLSPRYGLWYLKTLCKFCIIVVIIYFFINLIRGNNRYRIEMFTLIIISSLAICLSNWHFLFFIFGISSSRCIKLQNCLSSPMVLCLSSIIFVLSIFLKDLPSFLVSISAIAYCYNLKYCLSTIITKQLIIFGKYSMPIFILHFFIVNGFRVVCSDDPFLLFLIGLLFSLVISYICIIFYKISSLGLLPLFLWGEIKQKHIFHNNNNETL